VKLDKGNIVGREALIRGRQDRAQTRLVYVEVAAGEADVSGGEPLLTGELIIGVTT